METENSIIILSTSRSQKWSFSMTFCNQYVAFILWRFKKWSYELWHCAVLW